jgi:hypothetical protein
LIVLSGVPALRADFLFSDDYYWFDIQHSRPSAAAWEATMMSVMNGRPHGLLFIASFPAMPCLIAAAAPCWPWSSRCRTPRVAAHGCGAQQRPGC